MIPPESLHELPFEAPHNFLGLDPASSAFEAAGAVVLPVPYEATTSYGKGTRSGPAAILEASRHIEVYDHELDAEPFRGGICTLPALDLSQAGPEHAVSELGNAYRRLVEAAGDRFVVVLGGEHSISSAPILAWADALAARGSGRLSVLQLDAHTDLRPEYEGARYSHAAVMRQVSERVDIVAVGIRALTAEERAYADSADNVHIFFADRIHSGEDWIEEALERLGPDVYITLDVDCFDPSLVPGTGTPEPGGLGWYPVLSLLRRVFEARTVHAADIVELAPIPGQPAADFLVAKLLYKMIGYRFMADGRLAG